MRRTFGFRAGQTKQPLAERKPSIGLLALFLVAMAGAGCVSTDEQLRTLKAYGAISAVPSTSPDYDFTVLIRNLRPLGVDPTLKVDRERLASAYLSEKCPRLAIVSETMLATTMPSLGATSKDYAVRVKCRQP